MATVLWRLLAIAALVLMSFGMGDGSAVAHAPAPASPHHQAMDMGHCGDAATPEPAGKPSGHPVKSAHCALACTALPPADAAAAPGQPLPVATPPESAPACFAGIDVTPTPPPPRLS